MPIFTFEEYYNLIPDETKTFIKKLLSYLYNEDYVKISSGTTLYNEKDIFIYKCIYSYKRIDELHANILQSLSYHEYDSLESSNIGNSTMSSLFSKYYSLFTPLPNKESYQLLTPEDIITSNIRNLPSYKNSDIFDCIYKTPEDFLSELNKHSNEKREQILRELKLKFNKNFNINIINYYEAVGKIFVELSKTKYFKKIDHTSEDLINLSLLLGLYNYNHISQGNFNEREVIVNYLTSLGVTQPNIEQVIGYNLEHNAGDPTIILNYYFKDIYPKNISRENITITDIISRLFTSSYNNALTIKQLLSELNLTTNNVKDLESIVKTKKDELSSTSLDDLLKNLIPNVISYLKRINRIYTYLNTKLNTIDKNLISTKEDIILLSILLSSYEFNNSYSEFLNDKGLTIDKILELIKLPKLDEYRKELGSVNPSDKDITNFTSLITNGINYHKAKESITVESIILNTTDKSRTRSTLIHKLFKNITNESLDDDFASQIEKHLNNKNDRRKKILSENLLENISIDVYNYLRILSSYYQILKSKGLDQKDLEQLSIIYAASRYDNELEDYLTSIGMDRSSLSNAIGISFNYQDKPFDIDIINSYYKEYIFDRDPEEITVHTIFENAFKKELTNSLFLRRILDKFHKVPEDFLNIDSKLSEYNKKLKQEEEQNKIDTLLNQCDDYIKKLFNDILRIHEYLLTNISKLNLIKNEDDIEELSILIALFLNDEEYIPFFIHNGVTLDELLSRINLNRNILNEIKSIKPNYKLIFKYEKYIGRSYELTLNRLIEKLFNENINDSQILETITSLTGNNYSYLVEEVSNKKNRELTPEQGIKILSKEEVVPIQESTYGYISEYGTSISKHSKYISDALNKLIFNDSLEKSIESINSLLGEISYDEAITNPKKPSFFSKLFDIPEEPKVVKKYNPTKVGELQELVDQNILILQQELKGYEFIKKYIEIYLLKLSEYLKRLKEYSLSLDEQPSIYDTDDILEFTQLLNEQSSREIIKNKINTFETIILLMKQELITVHRSIINHFITINSLQTSKSAILPLIATEVAVNIGHKTESNALELTSNLIGLFQNVINKNIEATKTNLELLNSTNLSEDALASINQEISLYLESLNRSNKVLELNPPTDDEPTLKKS